MNVGWQKYACAVQMIQTKFTWNRIKSCGTKNINSMEIEKRENNKIVESHANSLDNLKWILLKNKQIILLILRIVHSKTISVI